MIYHFFGQITSKINVKAKKMLENRKSKELEEKIDLYINGQLSRKEVDELWIELIQEEYLIDYLKTVANVKAIIKSGRSTVKL